MSYPSGIVSGELLLAHMAVSTNVHPTTAPSGWTYIAGRNGGDATSGPSISVFYRWADGSESGTVSFSTGTTSKRVSGIMERWSGVDATTPFDVSAAGASGFTEGHTSSSITTVTNGAVAVFSIGIGASGSDITAATGTTQISQTTGTGRRFGVFRETRATAGAIGTRSWVKSGTGSLNWASLVMALRPSSGPAAPALVQRVVGIPETNPDTTVRITVKTTDATSVRLKLGTDSGVTSGVVFGGAVTPSSGNATLTATGLTANTRYYYRVEMTDSGSNTSLDTGAVGRVKTAPSGQASFSFDFASCCNASDSDSMAAIATRGDDLFFHLGDMYYADASGTGVANIRDKMNAKITATNHAAVFSTMNTTYTPSDHDGMNNDSNAGSDSTAWANWNTARAELWPMPASYYSFVWGRVRFIQLDRRSFASNPANTDNSSKTSLGTTQKTWFKNLIDSATEPLIVIIQESPWITSASSGDDAWAGYITERDELATHLSNSGKNIVMLGGDGHMVGADDGTNAPGGIVMLHGAPLNNAASQKGGPYSTGLYPSSGTSTVQQYGRATITDNGSSMVLNYVGYSSDNTSRKTLEVTYDLAEEYDATGNLSGSGTLTSTRTPAFSITANLSGSGTLTGTPTPAFNRSANLTGSGTLSTSVIVQGFSRTGSLSGSGTLTGTATPNVNVTGNLSGGGTLTSSRIVGFSKTGNLSGSGTLSSAGETLTASANGTLSGSGSLTEVHTQEIFKTVALSGSGTLTGSGMVMNYNVTAPLSGEGTLTVEITSMDVDVSFNGSGSGELEGFSTQDVLGNLTGSGQLSSIHLMGYAREVELGGTGTLVGTSRGHRVVSVNLGSTGVLAVSVFADIRPTGHLSSIGTLSAVGRHTGSASVAFTGSGQLTGTPLDSGVIKLYADLTDPRWQFDLGEQ
jgi:hypothetical protein